MDTHGLCGTCESKNRVYVYFVGGIMRLLCQSCAFAHLATKPRTEVI